MAEVAEKSAAAKKVTEVANSAAKGAAKPKAAAKEPKEKKERAPKVGVRLIQERTIAGAPLAASAHELKCEVPKGYTALTEARDKLGCAYHATVRRYFNQKWEDGTPALLFIRDDKQRATFVETASLNKLVKELARQRKEAEKG